MIRRYGAIIGLAAAFAIALIATAQQPSASQPPATSEPAKPVEETSRDSEPPPAGAARSADSPTVTNMDQLSGNKLAYEAMGESAIVITGTDSDLDILQALIDQLQIESERPKVGFLTLENARASELSRQVEQIFKQVHPNQDITVVADDGSNSLVIAAPSDIFEEITQLARQLDAQTPPLVLEYEVIELKFISPSDVATQLQEYLEKVIAQRPGGDKILEKVSVTPIDRNNTLQITAPKDYLKQIRDLIAIYDVEPQGLAKAELLYIPLLNANADKLAQSLTEMLEAQGQQAEDLREKILRLRMTLVAPDGSIEQLPELDLEKPIKIVAEENTNALIIATHDQNAEALREIVRLLDSVPIAPEMGVEFYPLKYGDAETVAAVLAQLFESGSKLAEVPGNKVPDAVPEGIPGRAMAYNVAIHADKRTNTVVIAGRPEQVALAHTVINQLDVEGKAFFAKTEFLYLEHTDATRVANVLTQLNDATVEGLTEREAGAAAIEKEKAIILPDLRVNAVIIMATEEKFQELSELAMKLDREVPEDYRNNIQIIRCENLNAATLVPKIDQLWERKREQYEEQELPPDMPIVVADERSNAVVIASSIEDYESIKKLVEDLERQPLNPLAMIRLLEVENNDSAQLATMLEQIFEARLQQVPTEEGNEAERVAIAADAATNTMLIASSPTNFAEIQRIVAALDVIPDLEGVVQTFKLENADAANVESKVRDLVITQGLYRPGSLGTDSAVTEQRDTIALIADARSNSLMVSASVPNMRIIEELVRQMDRSDVIDFGSARIFQLEHADAIKVSDILQQVFDGLEAAIPSGSQEVFVKPTFIAVEGSNALIVTGSRDAMHRTEDLLVEIDKPSDSPTSVFEVYTLKHAAAVKLAEKIQEMFEARQTGSDGERTPLNIQAVEGSNSMLVSASQEDHLVLEGLVEMLDIKSSLNQQLRIFNLETAKAENTATVLNDLFQREGADGPANAIAVQPVVWTNSIVVWATAGQMEDIENMIAKLDENQPTIEYRLETYQLKQAMADELAEAITTALSGEETGGDEQSAVIFSFFEEFDNGSRELRKLIRQDISIIPYSQTNTLLVMAPPDSAEMLLSLIARLDAIPPITADYEVFELVNADAEQIIDTLEQIFEISEAGDAQDLDISLAPGAGAGPGAGAAGGLRYGMTFAPDLRTNSVIAAGNQEYIDVVAKLIADLDQEAPEMRVVEFVHLNNSVSEEVAERLTAFNEQERDRLSELDDTISPYMQAQQLVTVVPDERTNSVFLSMSPKIRNQYLDFVRELDRAPEQVLIEFMLVEVSLDDLFELGMEFTIQDLAFSQKAVQGPNGIIQGPNKDVVIGTSLGAAGSGGGFTLTITGEDFSFLFHALQSAGRADLISRPSIVAEDNAEDARIAILNEVPTLRSVGADNAGNSITQVEYVEAGIDLQVTPHINPDGFIQLELDSQVTAVGPQVVVGDTTSVSIQGTQMTTTVTVKDGETVVIGGLIEANSRSNEQKVPLLGDLPIIGQVFRSNSDQSRRELLVVITATVIRSIEDFHRLSIMQRDLTDIIPERVKRSPLMGDLQVIPQAGDPVDIQDRDMLEKPDDEPQSSTYGPQPTRIYGPVIGDPTAGGRDEPRAGAPATQPVKGVSMDADDRQSRTVRVKF